MQLNMHYLHQTLFVNFTLVMIVIVANLCNYEIAVIVAVDTISHMILPSHTFITILKPIRAQVTFVVMALGLVYNNPASSRNSTPTE